MSFGFFTPFNTRYFTPPLEVFSDQTGRVSVRVDSSGANHVGKVELKYEYLCGSRLVSLYEKFTVNYYIKMYREEK